MNSKQGADTGNSSEIPGDNVPSPNLRLSENNLSPGTQLLESGDGT